MDGRLNQTVEDLAPDERIKVLYYRLRGLKSSDLGERERLGREKELWNRVSEARIEKIRDLVKHVQEALDPDGELPRKYVEIEAQVLNQEAEALMHSEKRVRETVEVLEFI